MTSSPAPTPAHEHEYHALWSHLGPFGRQDIHYHPCTEGEPGECYAVLVGYGVDCDGKRATHAARELPVPGDLVIPGEPQPETPAPTPVGAPGWLAEAKLRTAQRAAHPKTEAEGEAISDAMVLLAALEAVLAKHRQQDEPVVTTNVCGAHSLKSLKHAWARDEVAACPTCFKVERYVCVTCRHECPDHDEWPCVTYLAIEAALRDAQGGAG